MAAKPEFLYVGCDNLLELDGARRSDTAAYLNAATVTATLHSTKAAAIAGTGSLAGNVTMSYVAASNGVYRGTLESSAFTLVDGTTYYLRIVASQTGIDAVRILTRKAKVYDEAP